MRSGKILRDLTAGDVLLDKINGLSKRVASYPKGRPRVPTLPCGLRGSQADRLMKWNARVALRQAEYRACEDAAKNASAALHSAQVDENVITARISGRPSSIERLPSPISLKPEKSQRMMLSRVQSHWLNRTPVKLAHH